MPIVYNPNDVSITQMNSDSSSFVEQVLSSSPNSLVVFDSTSHLVTIPTQSFSSISASYAVSTSWAPFIDNPNAISASWASSSISSSCAINADTASYSSGSVIGHGILVVEYITSASYALLNPPLSTTLYIISSST